MQMDAQFPDGGDDNVETPAARGHRDGCLFPQLTLLEEIHEEAPDATFVLSFRPVEDWIESAAGWRDMLERFSLCHLLNLPRG